MKTQSARGVADETYQETDVWFKRERRLEGHLPALLRVGATTQCAAVSAEDIDMSDASDRDLGLGRSISRRDFLNGVAIGVGGTLASGLLPDALLRAQAADQARGAARYYPPTLTGMRGSHDGSWEAAHAMRDGRFWSSVGTPDRHAGDLRSGGRRRRHQRPVRGAFLPAARRRSRRGSWCSTTTTTSAATPSATSFISAAACC